MNVQALDVIRHRRTVRHFTAEDVTDNQIETLLEMAMYAPNRLNRQPWRFVVLRDPSLKEDLAHLLRVRPYLEQAPVLVAACAVPDVSPTWLEDVAASIENMLLAAVALDLGGTWIGSPDTYWWGLAEEHLHDKVHIPLDVRVVALIAIGHPSEMPSPHSPEDRVDQTKIHYGEWGHRHRS